MSITSDKVAVSGIVLAGGKSRRLGRNKAMEEVGGQALISRVVGRMSKLFSEVIVIVAEPAEQGSLPLVGEAKVVGDIHSGKGSLGGIYTGLSTCSNPWGMVVACDMPFLNLDLISHMLSLRQGFDAVVPWRNGQPEPTHAVYSKACLPYIEDRLKGDDLKISGFYDQVRVNYLTEAEVDQFDPERLGFFNINTQADLDRARSLAAGS